MRLQWYTHWHAWTRMANMKGFVFLVKASPDLNRMTPDIITAGWGCFFGVLSTLPVWQQSGRNLCYNNNFTTSKHRISHGFIIWIFISGALNAEHTCSTALLSHAGCISWKCVCSLREALEPTQLHFSSPQYLITTDAEKLHSGRRFHPVHRSSQSTMLMIRVDCW